MLAKTWELDINAPLPSLYLDPRYGRLDVLVLDGNRPLAVVPFFPLNGNRIISPDQMKEPIAWQRWVRICAAVVENAVAEPAYPPISVIVCTRDRPLSLGKCLDHLRALDYPHYEVLVVDNASSDPQVHEIVLRSGFRYVRENRPGLDWARNRGIQEARHDIIAYIDDDACASKGWLKGIAGAFSDPAVSAVTGLVLPAELETHEQSLFEQYGGMSRGFSPRRATAATISVDELIGVHQYGVGANMAYRRSVFERIGAFDTALDVGTPSFGGGDLDMFHRVLAGGMTLAYEPTAWVRHRHRRDRKGLRRQIYSNGRAFGIYLIKIWARRTAPRRAVASYSARWLTGWVLARVLKGIYRRKFFPLDISFSELRGAIRAPFAYFETYRHDRGLRNRAQTSRADQYSEAPMS